MRYFTSPLNLAIKLVPSMVYTFLINHSTTPKKIEVAALLKAPQKWNGGEHPNINAVPRLCNVSWHFLHKIKNEIDPRDRVLPATVNITKQVDFGPSSWTLNDLDIFIIMILYMDEPSHGLPTYVVLLHFFSGTLVSEGVLSHFFKKAFPFRAVLCHPNLIPYDEFHQHNHARTMSW